MSHKKLAHTVLMTCGTTSKQVAPSPLASLQIFVAAKKSCLSLHDEVVESKIAKNTSNMDLVVSKTNVLGDSDEGYGEFWRKFYDLECMLNSKLEDLTIPASITHIYNPIEYAANLHCAYLQKFLDGPKQLLFVGMNPGPNGMGQTGVPFGNVLTVREEMGIIGAVAQPPNVHPKRPVRGLECDVEEPSGARLWTLLKKLTGGSLDVFSRNCFVHNFCPLIFFDKAGRNITPSELKGDYKTKVGELCLKTLDDEIDIIQPDIIVSVGAYMDGILKHSRHVGVRKIVKLHHPSPRALNNQDWPQKAEELLQKYDLVKYIRNKA